MSTANTEKLPVSERTAGSYIFYGTEQDVKDFFSKIANHLKLPYHISHSDAKLGLCVLGVTFHETDPRGGAYFKQRNFDEIFSLIDENDGASIVATFGLNNLYDPERPNGPMKRLTPYAFIHLDPE